MKAKFTRHFWDRFIERFPHLMPYKEWERASAKNPTKKQLNEIKKRISIIKGTKYRMSPNGVLFVVADGHVVTCLNLEN